MPKNRQHNRKTKYPDKVTKPKCLVFVRIFLFSSVGIKIQYFPTVPFLAFSNFYYIYFYISKLMKNSFQKVFINGSEEVYLVHTL